MRNDLKDEPIDVPSLTIDDAESSSVVNGGSFQNHRKKSKSANGVVIFLLLLLFVICGTGFAGFYWVFRQSMDEVYQRLDQVASSASQVSVSNVTRWQEEAKQLADQQATMKASLEALRAQNKRLVEQLNKTLDVQQGAVQQQTEQKTRLQSLEQQVTQSDGKLQQVVKELAASKQSQENVDAVLKQLQDKKLAQSVQAIQDDVLLLRSQLDASTNNDSKQQLVKLEKQLQSLQSQVDLLRQQLSSRSLY